MAPGSSLPPHAPVGTGPSRMRAPDPPTDFGPVDLAPDPWTAVEAREPVAHRAALAVMGIEHLVHRGAPRDLALARRHLARHLPPGRWLLHGAGSHSRAILPTLEGLEGVEVVGVIDKLASALGEFEGHAVIDTARAAEWIRDGRAERVLLSNTIWELPMRATLIGAGVRTERIHGIYSDPRYIEASLAAHAAGVEEADAPPASGGARADLALVDFERQGQQVIDDETLAGVLPPARTLRLGSGRFETLVEGSTFRSVGFHDGLLLLLAMLERLAPRAIYLRTFPEDNLVGSILRRACPRAVFVHEPYDWALTLESSFLQTVHGHDRHTIQMALAGELDTARHADFVVSKRGGPAWERVHSELSERSASFYPQVEVRPAPALPRTAGDAPCEPRVKSLVYAGNLPAPHTLDHDMVGALFPLYERLTRDAGIRITVFNGSHRSSEMDATFAPYREQESERLVYHGAIPYGRLLRELEEHDYGWLYFPRDGIDFPDERVLISNKFTGYVCAGLPLLIDDGWETMATLVRRFDAGIVLPMREPERLVGALRQADVQAHRAGVRALRDHMVASNARVLERLRRCVIQ